MSGEGVQTGGAGIGIRMWDVGFRGEIQREI